MVQTPQWRQRSWKRFYCRGSEQEAAAERNQVGAAPGFRPDSSWQDADRIVWPIPAEKLAPPELEFNAASYVHTCRPKNCSAGNRTDFSIRRDGKTAATAKVGNRCGLAAVKAVTRRPGLASGAMVSKDKRSTLRVVVVDDNYDANAGLSRLLEKSGFFVAGRAYDGMAGLRAVKEAQPDVAILDIAMPALDGYELAKRIRSEMPEPPHLVALTGFGEESGKAEALKAGFEAYFCKPASWPAIERVLLDYLDQ
jgi:CheY-like chemotaxis protein